ncbi:MAG: hypothetical protein K2P44_12275 [Lachnospiraceae bacterium]|nr:hypothetical protein [Lachnospiraceae bacterium]
MDYKIAICDDEQNQIKYLSGLVKSWAGQCGYTVRITGYPDYIAQGYEVAALHYLMKPIWAEKLSEVLNCAVKKLHKKERSKLICGLIDPIANFTVYIHFICHFLTKSLY